MKEYAVEINGNRITTVFGKSPEQAIQQAHRALDRRGREAVYQMWLKSGGAIREIQEAGSMAYELEWDSTGHKVKFQTSGMLVEMYTDRNEFACEHPNPVQAAEAFHRQVADYLAMGWRVRRVWIDGKLEVNRIG